MANRRHSLKRIKRRWTYNVREAAKALGATPGTVRQWHKSGLHAVAGIWPLMFRGVDLIDFHKQRAAGRKQTCGPGRMFCLRCKAAKRPDLGMADYVPRTPLRGSLTGLCPDCGGLMHRLTSPAKLKAAAGNLDVSIPQAESRLAGTAEPNSNCHSEPGG